MCTERVALCSNCGYTRHIWWTWCPTFEGEITDAAKKDRKPPKPENCKHIAPAEALELSRRTCPTAGCGAVRKREQEARDKKQKELKQMIKALEKKDSAISGMGEVGSQSTASTDDQQSNDSWSDCAVTEDSVSPDRHKQFHLYPRSSRWKPQGPNIKYSADFIEVGPRVMKPNLRNMCYSYGLHLGKSQTGEDPGPDIVRPTRYCIGRDGMQVHEPVDLRDSIEPDETYLLMKQWHNIPEIREQWAERMRMNPGYERPVMTMADTIEALFGVPQNVRPLEEEDPDDQPWREHLRSH